MMSLHKSSHPIGAPCLKTNDTMVLLREAAKSRKNGVQVENKSNSLDI